MVNWLSNKIIENKVSHANKNSKREFVEWNDVRSVCVLVTKDDSFKANQLNEFLKNLNKTVDTILFIPNHEVHASNDLISFNKKQTSWIGLPKEGVLAKVTSKSYDLVIDCNFKEYNSMKWLAGSVNAKFKIGFGGLLYHNYFDICIDLKEKPDLDNYLKQVMNYLKMIRTKN